MDCMKKDEYEYVSEETGEVLNLRGLPFLKVHKDGLERMWILGNSNIRVLMTLLENMNRANFININRTEIGNELGFSRNTVSRSLDELKDSTVIWYNNSQCIVNPTMFWRGRDDELKDKTTAIFYDKLKKDRLNNAK